MWCVYVHVCVSVTGGAGVECAKPSHMCPFAVDSFSQQSSGYWTVSGLRSITCQPLAARFVYNVVSHMLTVSVRCGITYGEPVVVTTPKRKSTKRAAAGADRAVVPAASRRSAPPAKASRPVADIDALHSFPDVEASAAEKSTKRVPEFKSSKFLRSIWTKPVPKQ